MNRTFLFCGALLLVARAVLACAWAAPPVVLSVDMPGLIDRAAAQPERFAVDISHQLSVSTDGEWSATAAARVWSVAVQVPTAVSMSFHASRLALPPSAVLTVSGERVTVTYRARDAARGVLLHTRTQPLPLPKAAPKIIPAMRVRRRLQSTLPSH